MGKANGKSPPHRFHPLTGDWGDDVWPIVGREPDLNSGCDYLNKGRWVSIWRCCLAINIIRPLRWWIPNLGRSDTKSPCRVLDVGSQDVNGTLRPFAFGTSYIGVDLAPGPGVDIVIQPGRLPFADHTFDLVVSTSCLEHDPMFWVTFAEMTRVMKRDGFLYVSVPANGPYHGYPGDCWRFYGDAAAALASWAPKVSLIETFMMTPQRDVWTDNVMIFGGPDSPPRQRISG